MILDDIIKNKINEVAECRKQISQEELIKAVVSMPASRSFGEAISKPGRVNIITEIKRTSPSAGIIGGRDFNVEEIARKYRDNGADAISVLTDEKYFKGSIAHLNTVSRMAGIPVLRKDFIIDEYQVYESRYFGADAILLIASVLDETKIINFTKIASSMNMSCLTEVHTEKELEKALSAGAVIIGINNRNLSDFTVNIQTTARLRKRIPAGKIVVSESGIASAADMKLMRENGVNAVLVGESLLKANDISVKMKELLSW